MLLTEQVGYLLKNGWIADTRERKGMIEMNSVLKDFK